MERRTIDGFPATLTHEQVGADTIALWQVTDLERHVDRHALLAGDDPPEPPYWAHLWSGARVLAAAVPHAAGRVVELGCGLGLPGLVAARRGARVTLVDQTPAALAFAGASARTNGLDGVDLVAADLRTATLRGRFDLVLAAEVLYDRAAFPAVARALADMLRPGGRGLLADASRIDTRAFYPELSAAGLDWRSREHRVREEGLPVTVRLVEIRRA
jgi:2-polyprenyl-3-methyl-5-hydroxy-6-metoxy-1,4-benzoquinol methylase